MEQHVATQSTAAASDRYLAQIVTILAEVLKDTPCVIYLFGSRATGSAGPTSDYDLAALAKDNLSGKLSWLRQRLEQSDIPYKIDLVDLQTVSADFKQRVQAEGQVIWKR